MSMTPSRSYLVKALYEWILDNHCTPHILVFADAEGVDVPRAHVQNGQIVLNIDPAAVKDLFMDQQAISFNARFGGKETDIYIPMHAVVGIVTRENGQGMMFDFMEPTPPPETAGSDEVTEKGGGKKIDKKPSLRIVK